MWNFFGFEHTRSSVRAAFFILCFASCLMIQAFSCFAAQPAQQQKRTAPASNVPKTGKPATATASTAPGAGEQTATAAPDAPKTGGQRIISAEALFASMLVNAENGQPQAMISVGSLYEQGLGVPRNFTKALEWYTRAADAGEKEAYMRLGVCREIGMGATADMGKAVAAYEKSASLGYAPARHKMADLYLNGRGVPKDVDKGFDFLIKAAEAGESAAMNDLGQILRAGLYGRKADPEKARSWLAKAAETGHAQAILTLAAMLKDGVGGKVDPELALRWYLVARKAGINADGLAAVVNELQGKLSAKQAQDADKAADAWIAVKSKKQTG
jgi:TPR repeat protein